MELRTATDTVPGTLQALPSPPLHPHPESLARFSTSHAIVSGIVL